MARIRLAVHRSKFTARWQERNGGYYRLLCGNPRNCRGVLGWTAPPESTDEQGFRPGLMEWSIDQIARFNQAMGDETDLADRWIVNIPIGFYREVAPQGTVVARLDQQGPVRLPCNAPVTPSAPAQRPCSLAAGAPFVTSAHRLHGSGSRPPAAEVVVHGPCCLTTVPWGATYRDENGNYHQIKGARLDPNTSGVTPRSLHSGLMGRRPIPPTLRAAFRDTRESYDIIGRFPVLPAIIVCPRCNHPNEVCPPP